MAAVFFFFLFSFFFFASAVCLRLFLCFASLPGKILVDGFPPAYKYGCRGIGSPAQLGPIEKNRRVFLKKLSFYNISTFKTDFSWVRLGIAEAHAKRRGRLCVMVAGIRVGS